MVPYGTLKESAQRMVAGKYLAQQGILQDPRNMAKGDILVLLEGIYGRQINFGPEDAFRFSHIRDRNSDLHEATYPDGEGSTNPKKKTKRRIPKKVPHRALDSGSAPMPLPVPQLDPVVSASQSIGIIQEIVPDLGARQPSVQGVVDHSLAQAGPSTAAKQVHFTVDLSEEEAALPIDPMQSMNNTASDDRSQSCLPDVSGAKRRKRKAEEMLGETAPDTRHQEPTTWTTCARAEEET
jgi:hypothetical protein